MGPVMTLLRPALLPIDRSATVSGSTQPPGCGTCPRSPLSSATCGQRRGGGRQRQARACCCGGWRRRRRTSRTLATPHHGNHAALGVAGDAFPCAAVAARAPGVQHIGAVVEAGLKCEQQRGVRSGARLAGHGGTGSGGDVGAGDARSRARLLQHAHRSRRHPGRAGQGRQEQQARGRNHNIR